MASRGIRETITYQPASRYWPFQWIETGIFLALALTLTGACFCGSAAIEPDLPARGQKRRHGHGRRRTGSHLCRSG